MDVVAFGGRAILALVFIFAAVGKLVDRAGARQALIDFRVPSELVRPTTWLLPTFEIAVAAALLIQPIAQAASIAAALLLVTFMGGIAAAMWRGEAPECNCFGQIGSKPAGKGTLGRNAVLVALAAMVAVYGSGTNPGSWFASHAAAEVTVLALVLATTALVSVCVSLASERRKLRLELEDAEASLALFPPGLPVGAEAPSFSLPSADGKLVSLAGLIALGQPVGLMFISPSCRPCHYMLPDISRWQKTLGDRLTITLIAHGSLDEAQQMAQKFGLINLLSDPEAEAFRRYRGTATPSLVIITPNGKIGIRIRSSHGAVEAAIRRALRDPPVPNVEARPEADRSLIDVAQWPGHDVQPA